MLTNARKPRNNPIKSTLALSLLMCAWTTAAACSISSSEDSAFDGSMTDVTTTPACDNVLPIEPDTLPSGSCDSTKTPICTMNGDGTCGLEGASYTCNCSGSWSCTITGGGFGGCGSPNEDAGSDANTGDADLDASDDASDGDAF